MSESLLYISLDLGHSLPCYLLCLVEAAVVGRALDITCSWWHWWEGLLFGIGRHIVLAPMVMISGLLVGSAVLAVANLVSQELSHFDLEGI